MGQDTTTARSSWQHFSHDADIGVAGIGPTKAEAFRPISIATSPPSKSKGATLTALEVAESPNGWRVQCVVDVWTMLEGWGDADAVRDHWGHGFPIGGVAAFDPKEGGIVSAGPGADAVSVKARHRQQDEMGTLGSGNHCLEVQRVAEIYDSHVAGAFGLALDDVVIHSLRLETLGHQIGAEFLKEMAVAAPEFGIALPDRELACALGAVVNRR